MFLTSLDNEFILTYIDKEENIAEVNIEINKISSLKKELGKKAIISPSFLLSLLLKELENLGFSNISRSVSYMDVLNRLKYLYSYELEFQKQEAKKQEFDF